MLTFRVVLHCALQILHDPLLSNDLLDPALIINVEGVLVEPCHLALTLYALPLLTIDAASQFGGEGGWVVHNSRQAGLLPLELRSHGGTSQYLQAERLGIR